MTAEIVSFGSARAAQANDQVRDSIRALLRACHLRVEDLADMAGMASSTMYQRLAGKGNRKVFPIGDVAAIADVFEVSVENLLTGQLDLAKAKAAIDRRLQTAERSVNNRNLTTRQAAA
jgi:transcriptional regulator with XRE-family HTH domain